MNNVNILPIVLKRDGNMYNIVSNSCIGSLLYKSNNEQYSNPLIGSLFLNDFSYIKFLENYDFYMNLVPKVFLINKNNIFNNFYQLHNDFYTLMILDDIEIHWIHETNINHVLDNWDKRKKRIDNNNRINTWTSSEFMQEHNDNERKLLIDRFCALPNFNVLLTEREEESKQGKNFIIKFIPEWNDKQQNDRFNWGFLKWNNQIMATKYLQLIIKNEIK